MKALITALKVKELVQRQEKVLYVEQHSIFTPAARDMAKEYGITIVENANAALSVPEHAPDCQTKETINSALIARIVAEVQASLNGNQQALPISKEGDPSGLRLIRQGGASVEDFYIAGQPGKVKMKEILSIKESSRMVSGFMTMDDAVFTTQLKNDEVSYITAGTLTCTINDNKYTGEAGDTFFIPAGTTVTYSTIGMAKIFFVVSPQ